MDGVSSDPGIAGAISDVSPGVAVGEAVANDIGSLSDIGFDFSTIAPAIGVGNDLGVESNIADLGINALPSSLGEDANDIMHTLVNNPVAKGLLGILGIVNPQLAIPLNIASIPFSNDPGKSILSNIVGQGFGQMGPIGSVVGMGINSAIGNSIGNTQGAPGMSATGGVGDSPNGESLLSGLAGLYSGYQGMKTNGQLLGGLQGLFSQNSPYSQAMRQQLERRDAAGGRRSQYGPREVELQAKLAQLASGQIPAMSQLSNNQAMMRALMLKSGLTALNNIGGLQGIFGPMGGQQSQLPGLSFNLDNWGQGINWNNTGGSFDPFNIPAPSNAWGFDQFPFDPGWGGG